MFGAAFAGAPWTHRGGPCASDWFAQMSGHGGQGGRERRRGPHSGPGFAPPWAVFGGHMPWGPPPWAGGPSGAWRPPKARRGDVRAAILGVLAEDEMNGYQIIQAIAERSGGRWKPSPGSVYPTLQQLEDEGLVRADEHGGRRTFHLTAAGRAYVETHAEQIAAPWTAFAEPVEEDDSGLKPLIGQVAAALWQVVATGTPDQQARAREAVTDLRRRLYGILADDDLDGAADDETDGGSKP